MWQKIALNLAEVVLLLKLFDVAYFLLVWWLASANIIYDNLTIATGLLATALIIVVKSLEIQQVCISNIF
jgi:hypothetical protein